MECPEPFPGPCDCVFGSAFCSEYPAPLHDERCQMNTVDPLRHNRVHILIEVQRSGHTQLSSAIDLFAKSHHVTVFGEALVVVIEDRRKLDDDRRSGGRIRCGKQFSEIEWVCRRGGEGAAPNLDIPCGERREVAPGIIAKTLLDDCKCVARDSHGYPRFLLKASSKAASRCA